MSFHSLDEFEQHERNQQAESDRAVNWYQMLDKPVIDKRNEVVKLLVGSFLLFVSLYGFVWLFLHLDGKP